MKALALVLLLAGPVWAQHLGDILVGRTASGQLATAYDFGRRILVTEGPSFGGVTLWSGTDPGFDLLVDPEADLLPLSPGTQLGIEVTALEADVSMKLGDDILDAPGDAATLGTAPLAHIHPEWRLALPDGAIATRLVSFRLTSTAAGVGASAIYTATVTNDPTPPPSTTTTTLAPGATTTTTSLPPRDPCDDVTLDALACRLDRFAEAVAATATTPKRVGRKVTVRARQLQALVAGAADAKPPARRRRLAQAAKRLDALLRTLDRKRDRLAPGAADALRELGGAAAATLGQLRANGEEGA